MAAPTSEPSFADTSDFEDAERGFIGTLEPCIVTGNDGRVILDNGEYAFLQKDCPSTVNPKLWRQGKLNSKHGLFEVTEGIYQVRGLDLSNMSIIEGESGVVVMDPLVSTECARAALDLYRKRRGQRPVKAVVYTHSHIDHFGGALGVLPESSTGHYDIPIIAPEGFMEEALGENVFAGPIMRQRAVYMYGSSLPRGPTGQVGCGLGMATSRGTTSLIPPNDLIQRTGEERTIDGVRIVFQMVPETEAPAEINLYFPDYRALCIAECATQNMHNVITLRGALVRDAKRWSKYLDETIALYGERSDVLFAGHNWPTWTSAKIVQFIAEQRDMYAYMHDQTVRLMNQGLNGVEIAEQLRLPPSLQEKWHTQGYYGSLSHNVKGIYQRYMTWFDGNPANLWKHTPTEEAKRYVACMGGVDAVLSKAKEYAGAGDLRFASTLLDHAVKAEPSNEGARIELATVYEQLGHGAENSTWRNFYLTGAQELGRSERSESVKNGQRKSKSLSSINPQSTIEQWFDGLSVQLDGPRASDSTDACVVNIKVPEEDTLWSLRLSNSALTHASCPLNDSAVTRTDSSRPNLTATLSKDEVYRMLAKGVVDATENSFEGDLEALRRILSLCGIDVTTENSSQRSTKL